MTITAIIIYFILGTITAYFANKYNKNPYLWFILGMLFGIWGLLFLFFLIYKLKIPKKKINIEKVNIIKDSRFWYYLDGEHKKFGPFSLNKLKNLFSNNQISSKTYVWNKDLNDWKFLKDLKEYSYFQKNKNTTS